VQNLERHLALEARIPRPIHLADSAAPERRANLIGVETGPGCKGYESLIPYP
jgi:hypothetical protein